MKIPTLLLSLSMVVTAAAGLGSHAPRHVQVPERAAAAALAARGRTESRQATAPKFDHARLYKMQRAFLDAFLYPENEAQAKSINSTIFSDDVQGRVDITRTFDGQELNTEYIFGLFANLAANQGAFTLLGFPTSYEIVHFTANHNIAAASTRFNFTFPSLQNLSIPVVIDTWNVFDDAGKISMYDATFKWWQWTVDFLLSTAAQGLNKTLVETVTFATQELAGSICNTAQQYCNGTDAQYSDVAACKDHLTTQVRFGSAYELGRNTLLCRMVHQNMVPYRPSVHCPHIGPTGGGYCTDDTTYESTVMQDYFSNYPFAPVADIDG